MAAGLRGHGQMTGFWMRSSKQVNVFGKARVPRVLGFDICDCPIGMKFCT